LRAVAGIALGIRYKIVILLGAIALAITFAMMIEIARGVHVSSIILAVAISATAIQLGYLAGILIRAAFGRAIAACSRLNHTERSTIALPHRWTFYQSTFGD
jgi:hypothetical protein